MVPLSRKHGHRMVEYAATTLYSLIQPAGSMALFIEWDRECLATAVIHSIDKCHVELIRVIREMMST